MIAKNTKINSVKQERAAACSLNGDTVIGSGCLWFAKADVRNKHILCECKTTEKSFYPLKLTTWRKITKEATKDGLRYPIMQIDLETGKYQYAVMNYLDFRGFDLDKFIYSGSREPIFTEDKSFRIKTDLMDEVISTDKNMIPIQQVKFVNDNIHLVILDWKDFLNLYDTIKFE